VFHGEWSLPGGIEPLRLIFGGLLFYLPGLMWTWALTPRLAWAYRVPLSIVAAFTIQPGAMLLLNLVFFVPINIATTVYLSSALTLIALAILIRNSETPWDPGAWDEAPASLQQTPADPSIPTSSTPARSAGRTRKDQTR
jgi:hypothetical protein